MTDQSPIIAEHLRMLEAQFETLSNRLVDAMFKFEAGEYDYAKSLILLCGHVQGYASAYETLSGSKKLTQFLEELQITQRLEQILLKRGTII